MYLARRFVNNRLQYMLRESYPCGDCLASRDLIDLGDDPGRFIVYPGGSSFYIDDWIFDQLDRLRVSWDYSAVEQLFLPFLDPFVRAKIEPFARRRQNAGWRPLSRAAREEVIGQTHVFDRRRLYFLRLGQTDLSQMDRSPGLYKVLLHKSRDEIEQLILEREQQLRPHEYKRYIFAIFDLQRFFEEGFAVSMPQALDGDKLDDFFLQEVCRLDRDSRFWQGLERSRDRLVPYLIRYVIMYFDYSFPQTRSWNEYVRARTGARRRHRPSRSGSRMNLQEIGRVFGLSRAELSALSRSELTRLYRRKAHELHPDKGGDHDRFIELTSAYQELLRSRR